MRREHSIEPEYFEALYKDKGDPWEFETSAYEAAKYDETLAALPKERFESALEVGCANGVLTARAVVWRSPGRAVCWIYQRCSLNRKRDR